MISAIIKATNNIKKYTSHTKQVTYIFLKVVKTIRRNIEN